MSENEESTVGVSTDNLAKGDFIDPDTFYAQTKSKGTKKQDPELTNFLSRVDDISSIIQGLASENTADVERAIRQADILLHDGGGEGRQIIPDSGYKVTADRSVINKIPDIPPGTDMSQEAFMKMCEKDAKERAADRKERKMKSDEFRKKGNLGFKKENYAEALDNYNKAIELIKDSPILYMNRALTYIRIGICTKAISDLDISIDLNPKTIKGRLLKARAYFNLAEAEAARGIIKETLEMFPENEEMILEYQKDLFDLKMDVQPPHKMKNKAQEHKDKEVPIVSDAEEIWRKAARHEIGTNIEQHDEQSEEDLK